MPRIEAKMLKRNGHLALAINQINMYNVDRLDNYVGDKRNN